MGRPLPPTELEERVARKLCLLRGLDPEDRVNDGPLDGTGHAVLCRWMRWHHVVLTEVRAHLEREDAARAVRAEFAAEVEP